MNTIGIYKNSKPPFVTPLIKIEDVRQIWVDASPLLKEGDIVKVSYHSKNTSHRSRLSQKYIGKILEKVTGTEHELDKLLVEYKYGLDKTFNHKINSELENLLTIKDEFPNRKTIEKEFIVTIDSEKAKDLDDAVSVKKKGSGYELSVYIADVTHFVRPGTEIDKEAYERGTSIYYANEVIPMLPNLLSTNYCSLNPNEPKLVMGIKMKIDKNGAVKDYSIFPARIVITQRWAYKQINKVLRTPGHDETSKNAILMRELMKVIRDRRLKEGSIDFDMDEIDVKIDEQGRTTSINRVKRGDSERMIEEFMLIANKIVAQFLAKQEMPGLYRIHDIPDIVKIGNFNNMISQLNMDGVNIKSINPKAFQAIITATREKEHEKLINFLVLRTMQAACYSSDNRGHFGLAFSHYTQFTSPIRRYPDLIVHRLLKHIILNKKHHHKPIYTKSEIDKIAVHSSAQERRATDVERYYLKLKQVRFLKHKIGQVYDGVISGMNFNGVYVELMEYPVEGLIPKTLMMDDYYIYDEKQSLYIGRNTRNILSLGKKVRIKVAKVDDTRFFVDFESVKL